MANLVGNHIGLGEITRSFEPLFQLAKERGVEINLLVHRTIKRPRRRLGKTARRLRRIGEQDQLRIAIFAPCSAEQVVPHVLRIGQHRADELLALVVDARFACRARLERPRLSLRLPLIHLLQQRHRVAAEEPHEQDQEQRADPAANHGGTTHTHSAAILDVFTLPLTFPAHSCTPRQHESMTSRTLQANGVPSDRYASGVTPRTMSNFAASSPIFDSLIGVKSMVIRLRSFSSVTLRQRPSRSLPGWPLI